jgi:hypothetical protein
MNIRLECAALCPSCEVIFETPPTRCPACLGRHVLILSRVLGTALSRCDLAARAIPHHTDVGSY